MAYEFIMLSLGTVMALRPGLFSGLGSKRRQRRLLALEAGAPEKYFEERRALQAYRPTPRTMLMWRALGASIAVASAVGLVSEWRAENAAREQARIAISTARAAVANSEAAIAKAESGDPVAVAEAEAALRTSEAALTRAEHAQDEVDRLTGP
ncbi:MAG: hypothetical protein KAF27_01695 [Porphyrobacter sp.]|nr:hypothetical protein [Porphyrobacter sp.]